MDEQATATVRQIAEVCGVSKSTVVRCIDELGLRAEHTQTVGRRGTLVLDAYASGAVADRIARNRTAIPQTAPDAQSKDLSPVIEAYKTQIDTLTRELNDAKERERQVREDANRQIATKDAQIADLLTRLETSQEDARAERQAREDADATLRRVAGASLWQRLRGFKGFLPAPSDDPSPTH